MTRRGTASPRRSLALVSCVKTKAAEPAEARDLYTSTWFRKARAYVEARSMDWFVLSAKYGLVEPGRVIAPYELTLGELPAPDRRNRATGVVQALRNQGSRWDRIVVLAGVRYREHLIDELRTLAPSVEIPMQGLSFGPQLSWFDYQMLP